LLPQPDGNATFPADKLGVGSNNLAPLLIGGALLVWHPVSGCAQTTSESKWGKAWLGSVAVLAAANTADVLSSRNLAEMNPFLRNQQGNFSAGKAALIKASATGGFIFLQWLIRRGRDRKHFDKPFAIINLSAAGAVGATAAHNFCIPRNP